MWTLVVLLNFAVVIFSEPCFARTGRFVEECGSKQIAILDMAALGDEDDLLPCNLSRSLTASVFAPALLFLGCLAVPHSTAFTQPVHAGQRS